MYVSVVYMNNVDSPSYVRAVDSRPPPAPARACAILSVCCAADMVVGISLLCWPAAPMDWAMSVVYGRLQGRTQRVILQFGWIRAPGEK